MKRPYVLILVFVAGVAACLLLSRIAYQRGYRTALDHQKAQLIMTLNSLDQIHAGDVAGSMAPGPESGPKSGLERRPLDGVRTAGA